MKNFIILSLGSNEGDRKHNLKTCLEELKKLIELKNISNIYESDALLLPNSPPEWNLNFYNICVSGFTDLSPENLLREIKHIESEIFKRKKDFVWGPRNIDIDIIAFNDEVVKIENLTIPHERMLERTFVVWPMAEIEPEWIYPGTTKKAIELAQSFGLKYPEELGIKEAPLNTKISGKL